MGEIHRKDEFFRYIEGLTTVNRDSKRTYLSKINRIEGRATCDLSPKTIRSYDDIDRIVEQVYPKLNWNYKIRSDARCLLKHLQKFFHSVGEVDDIEAESSGLVQQQKWFMKFQK